MKARLPESDLLTPSSCKHNSSNLVFSHNMCKVCELVNVIWGISLFTFIIFPLQIDGRARPAPVALKAAQIWAFVTTTAAEVMYSNEIRHK